MSKKTEKIKIYFCGNNSYQVTGSMIYVETANHKILLECGMSQGFNLINSFKENNKKFPFKPKEIDYLFICHTHIDHSGLIPKLVRDGFKGKIITSDTTATLLKPMLTDSCGIIRKDADYIARKTGNICEPFYTEEDVKSTLNLLCTYDFSKVHDLDDEISFKFLKNSHLVGAYQLELFIKNKSGHVNKILYTSDIGHSKNDNYYVDDLELCKKADIVISECTYGSNSKDAKSYRSKDLEKIKTVVEQTCIDNKGRVLIPVFSLGRSQQLLTDLYMLYGNDPTFNIPVIVDSPLIWEVTKAYKEFLTSENKELFDKVCAWKNVKFIKDYLESKACVVDKSPAILLSSSGFLTKGRSVNYLKEIIVDEKCHLLSVGYTPPESLAGKIKSGQKTVTIEGKPYKNRCGITMLNSFSSHISNKELFNYLKSINTSKIYLVHGDMVGKIQFKEKLDDIFAEQCRTTKVISCNKDTICNL
ncbi:MAG TPA: MBL fold metallo-hydrolase [Candidatus Paceibacterota bacterium]